MPGSKGILSRTRHHPSAIGRRGPSRSSSTLNLDARCPSALRTTRRPARATHPPAHGSSRASGWPCPSQPAHVGPKDPAPIGQVVLGHPGGEAKFADADAEGTLERDRHRRTLATVHCFVHTLIRTSTPGTVAPRHQGARMDNGSNRVAHVAVALLLAGCASSSPPVTPESAKDAIELGRKVSVQQARSGKDTRAPWAECSRA